MKKSLISLAILLFSTNMLAACTTHNSDDWPRLDEGFELRPAIAATPNVESNVENNNIAPSQTPAAPIAQQPETNALMAEIEAQKQKYSEAIAQVKTASDENKQQRWFSAQLEFSRLNALRDDLLSKNPSKTESMATYLAALNAYIATAGDEVSGLEP